MGSSPETCFRLRGVRKTFRDRHETVTALDCGALDIPWNSRIAVLGHSGSGKSTLLNLLGLLDTPDDGPNEAPTEMAFNGHSLLADRWASAEPLGAAAKDRLRRQDFGFVFQFHHLLTHLLCQENVKLQLGLAGASLRDQQARAQGLLAFLGMTGHGDKYPPQLSGGEAQRIAVLRAVAHDPRVVFADEPTGNLDPVNADRVMQALVAWQERSLDDGKPRTLLMTTHKPHEALQYCDHFLILERGRPQQGRLFRHAEFASAEVLSQRLVPASLQDPDVSGARGAPNSNSDGVESVASECVVLKTTDAETESPEFAPPVSPPSESVADPASVPAAPHDRTLLVPCQDELYGAPRLSYLCHLGWQDLRGHFWSAFTSGLMILLLVVLAVVGWGLLDGKRRALSRELETPLALRLDANCLLRGQNVIDAKLLDDLARTKLANGRPIATSMAGLYPWSLADRLFWDGRQNPPRELVDHYVSGRTIQANDPILPLLAGWKEDGTSVFTGDQTDEIVVTETFLNDCHYPRDAPHVWLEHKGEMVRLTVRAVVTRLPGEYRFLLPDGRFQRLATEQDDPNQGPRALCGLLAR